LSLVTQKTDEAAPVEEEPVVDSIEPFEIGNTIEYAITIYIYCVDQFTYIVI
jgi:hypothetical protein